MSTILDTYYKQRRDRIIKRIHADPTYYIDPLIDNNQILTQIKFKSVSKIVRLGTLILIFSYFVAIFQYISFKIEVRLIGKIESGPHGTFLENEGIESKSDMDKCIAMLYFAVTTLSTVGFGDYYPHTNTERAIMTVILLSGVMVFSLLMGTFVEILSNYKTLTAENEDSTNLARFFGLMK
jgi:hypothetical protein